MTPASDQPSERIREQSMKAGLRSCESDIDRSWPHVFDCVAAPATAQKKQKQASTTAAR